MEAQKFIESRMEADFKIVKYHVVDVDISKEDLKKLLDKYEDYDGEEKYLAGIFFDLDDDVFAVDLKKFIKSFRDSFLYDGYVDDIYEEEVEDYKHLEELINNLEAYEGYVLYLGCPPDDPSQ